MWGAAMRVGRRQCVVRAPTVQITSTVLAIRKPKGRVLSGCLKGKGREERQGGGGVRREPETQRGVERVSVPYNTRTRTRTHIHTHTQKRECARESKTLRT